MAAVAKTQREIAEHFGFSDKFVVKRLRKRERDKDAKLHAGMVPRPKGHPRKDATPRNVVAEQASPEDGKQMIAGFSAIGRKEVKPRVKYQIIYMSCTRYPVSTICWAVQI